jgi:hypothetical protein
MFNKIFLGYQPRQMVEWRKNQRFKDHLCPRPQGNEVAGVPIRGWQPGKILLYIVAMKAPDHI